MKVLVVLQPSYLPWLGFFDQLNKADVFIYYDCVQYDKNGWRNRNKIKSATGAKWITVPVKNARRSKQALLNTEIAVEHRWEQKHIKMLKEAYSRSKYLDLYMPDLEKILLKKHERLVDLIYEINAKVIGWLGIETKVLRASEFPLEGDRSHRLLNLCHSVGASAYLSGSSARSYLETSIFEKTGVSVIWQDYLHPVYNQLHGPFLSHLSIVDLLFNEGPDSKHIL